MNLEDPRNFREWANLGEVARRWLIHRLPLLPEIDAAEAELHQQIRDNAPKGEKEAAVAEYVSRRERLAADAWWAEHSDEV